MVVDMTIDDGGVDRRVGHLSRARPQQGAARPTTRVAAWLDGDGPAPGGAGRVPGLDAQVRLQDAIAARLRDRREERRGARVRPLRAAAGRRGGRRQGAAHGDDEPRQVDHRELHGRGQRRDRAVPDRSRLRLDPPRREVARAVGAHRRLASQHGGDAARRAGRARAAAVPEGAARGRAGHVPGSVARDHQAARTRRVRRRERRREADAAISRSPTGDYTHSTAPNRRFPDLVTQRLVKAAIAGRRLPYRLRELRRSPRTARSRRTRRTRSSGCVRKAAAALWLTPQIGKTFDAVVTGAVGRRARGCGSCRRRSKGRLERGAEGLDVGDRVRVRLRQHRPANAASSTSRARRSAYGHRGYGQRFCAPSVLWSSPSVWSASAYSPGALACPCRSRGSADPSRPRAAPSSATE